MRREQNIFRELDWITIGIWLIMVVCGWFTIYAACFDFENYGVFDLSLRHGQQIIWIGISIVAAVIMLVFDTKFYSNIAPFFYLLMIIVLFVTIFVAPDVKGSHSWIQIGGFRMQPAEFAKYATALALSKYMSSYGYDVRKTKDFWLTALLIGAPMLIIIGQQETGSALVFAVFVLVLYREGLNGDFLIYGALAALFFVLVIRYNNLPQDPDALVLEQTGYTYVFFLAVLTGVFQIVRYTKDSLFLKVYLAVNIGIWVVCLIIKAAMPSKLSYTFISSLSFLTSAILFIFFSFIRRSKAYLLIVLFFVGTAGLCYASDYAFDNVLQPHQQIRIKVVLGLEDDPQGAGYNVRQAKIAIGSGGFAGKGFLNGTQTKLNYVPEQHTDFIFCTIGEEKGFIGTTGVILLYVIFILRLITLAERQRSKFSRIYGYSVACIFFFHFCINIGMVIGILPVIGIPLPFFSYGGSSMLAFTILLFTFIKLDTQRMDTLAA